MPYCPTHGEEWDDVYGSCPQCFHTIAPSRHPAILFIGAGLISSAITLIGSSALASPIMTEATVCPAGEEVVTINGEDFCQPTTPLTFPKQDDRGSGRLKDARGEFPEQRCGSGGEAPRCT